MLSSTPHAVDEHEDTHVSALPEVVLESTEAEVVEASATAPFDLSQTFLLHSNPGATKTIYLDFDGHVTTGTSWNTSYNEGKSFTTPAYSFEGGSAFSDAELERIQRIWQRVSEDYIPFDVNVTTQDPGVNALRKSTGGDNAWGIRVVIGGSSYDWYGSGAGGVAYLNSFNWSSDTPAFVFNENLGNGSEKYVAEAAAHEAGHTLGLSHDGRNSPTETYYKGHGSGDTGWAPIMGISYYESLTQWSKGEYTSASNTQDDLSIITTRNGFGYRADDHGNTMSSATQVSLSDGMFTTSGIIGQTSDVDVFSFTAVEGIFDFSVTPFERGPNLDVYLALFDSDFSLIGESNPVSSLEAGFSFALDAADYYLLVDGVGMGDPLTTGYSDYGSLGQYTLQGAFSAAIPDPAKISVWAGTTEIIDGQTTPIFIGAAWASDSQPSRTFTIRNDGEQTLELTAPFADTDHFIVSDPQLSVLTAGQSTSFTVTLRTDVVWSGSETVTFFSSDSGGEIFDFVVAGDVAVDPQIAMGDFDRSGAVEQSDLTLLLSSWGTSTAPGTGADASGDGIVEQDDLTALLNNWGATLAADSGQVAEADASASPEIAPLTATAAGPGLEPIPHWFHPAERWRSALPLLSRLSVGHGETASLVLRDAETWLWHPEENAEDDDASLRLAGRV